LDCSRGFLPEGNQASGSGERGDEALLGRVAFVFLDGRPEVLRGHMSKRTGHFMPVSMLDSQLATLERPRGEPLVLRQDVIETADCIVAASTKWLRGIAF
jgi:gluconokinase